MRGRWSRPDVSRRSTAKLPHTQEWNQLSLIGQCHVMCGYFVCANLLVSREQRDSHTKAAQSRNVGRQNYFKVRQCLPQSLTFWVFNTPSD
jgi:hypothetical protein